MGVLKTKGDRIALGKPGQALVLSYQTVQGATEPEGAPTLSATVNFFPTGSDDGHVFLPPIRDAGHCHLLINQSGFNLNVYATPPDTFPNEPDYIAITDQAAMLFVAINPGGQKLWYPIYL